MRKHFLKQLYRLLGALQASSLEILLFPLHVIQNISSLDRV